MVHLLLARATVDMCCPQVISETEVGHHQNEIDTSEAIAEIKAQYATMIGDAENAYGTAIRTVEAVHLASTSRVEVTKATSIRRAKAANAAQASKLQWQHQESMQNLEEEALEEEKCVHQSFLWACGAALQACPNHALAKLMYPLHLFMRSPSLPGPLMETSPFTARLRNPVTSPITPVGLPLLCPFPGLNNADLQSEKLKQIILGSQPHKGGERKIPWQGTWGIPACNIVLIVHSTNTELTAQN